MGFRVRFRGFDRTEVVAALAKLASENEDARREIERLGAEMEQLSHSLDAQPSGDGDVQRVLTAAAKVGDEIRQRAEEEARRMVAEAEGRAEQITQRLRDQTRAFENEIQTLLARRREIEASIESFLNAVTDELEHVRLHQDERSDNTLAQTG
jgi:cell division initiation protein